MLLLVVFGHSNLFEIEHRMDEEVFDELFELPLSVGSCPNSDLHPLLCFVCNGLIINGQERGKVHSKGLKTYRMQVKKINDILMFERLSDDNFKTNGAFYHKICKNELYNKSIACKNETVQSMMTRMMKEKVEKVLY